ncbi:hypothetical protein IV203_025710 [Nitzschia inconspicua]|uniref:Uncharacterized protein n=1 Tax=Nitzschia inconspicua TaxID=303405 RepID=A0A9K3LGL7_9STRA|nr:hypothetical protein IV203_025710 [Nitzschia inconspicua]
MSNNIPRPTSLFSSFLSATGMTSFQTEQQNGNDDGYNGNNNSNNYTVESDTTLPPVPSSLLASTLPPSLLADAFSSNFASTGMSLDGTTTSATTTTATTTTSNTGGLVLPPRPRRMWEIQDKLRPIPPYYPPLDPNCTCLVTDVSASVVASRITECLRKRSIAAEYDEESAMAQCMTVDRSHFTIYLYRGNKSRSMVDQTIFSVPSPPIIVECQRQSGNVASFHSACYAVLQAAKGNDTGSDKRKPQFANGMEFQSLSPAVKRRRLLQTTSSSSSGRPETIQHRHASTVRRMSTISSPSMAAEAAFEGALELLQKDRLECQVLGMERLVNLTNEEISGGDVCDYVSQRLLQDDWLVDSFLMHPEAEQAMAALKTTKTKSKRDRSNQEFETTALIRSFLESPAAVAPSPRFTLSEKEDRNPTISPAASQGEEMSQEEYNHEAKLRSLALRVLCNALYSLQKSGSLQDILWPRKSEEEQSSKRKCGISNSNSVSEDCNISRLIQPPFLLSLVQDMQGASRPPSVSEIGFQLASVHESALAIRCLRLLAGCISDSNGIDDDDDDDDDMTTSFVQARVQDFLRNEVVLESLELARSYGRATHSVLQMEAEQTYAQLTEDVRSC